MDGSVQICLGFTVSQWGKLHTRLINADGANTDDQGAWHCAITVFERRIHERFLSCVEALETSDSKSHITVPEEAPADCSTLPQKDEAVIPGFAILALCCLLAETLQSFRSKTEMPKRQEVRCLYPDGPCISVPKTSTTDAFKAFLRRPAFGGAFADEQIASSFVHGVRNGILHEAETRGWVIRRNRPENQIAAKEGDGYALNRTMFYRALKDDFAGYLAELRNPESLDLRARFRRKMNEMVKEA
jgi:hypothetical protein